MSGSFGRMHDHRAPVALQRSKEHARTKAIVLMEEF
jgi:hypothetical protein